MAGGRRRARGRPARRSRGDPRPSVRAFLAEIKALPSRGTAPPARRRGLPHAGVAARRGAATRGALELLVIEEEFRAAKVAAAGHQGRRVGAADPDRATARPSSRSAGSRRRCAARSSGASCSASPARAPTSRRCRRAPTRVEGGWVLNGQKVWTSMAQGGRLGHLPRPHRPRACRSTTASRASWST